MGGRGASSGISKLLGGGRGNKPYGSQYEALLTIGNVKFVRKRNEADESLMESKTPNRVYGLIDQHNNLKSIIYTDKNGLRTKQIDIDGRHGGDAHVHRGYFHNENSPNKKPTGLLSEERKMVERLRRIWDNHKSKS